MKKILTKIVGVALGLAMAIGVGAGIAAASNNKEAKPVHADSNTIVFTTGESDGSLFTTSTTASSTLSSGASYVASTPYSSIDRAYGPSAGGLKLGTNGKAGSVTIALSSSITPTSVVVSAKRYNSGKAATLNVNSNGAQSLTADFDDYTYSITTSISNLILASSNYCYVESITINYSSGGGQELATLTAPVLSLNGTVVSWANIDGNNGYSYFITGTQAKNGDLAEDTTSLDVSTLSLPYGSYSITIVAKGDNSTTSDSPSSSPQAFVLSEPTISGSFNLFSGALVEGDYVVCSGSTAMKNVTTAAPRIDVDTPTISNNKITDPKASIVWHIAKDGDYWTFYNDAVEKYAAFTGTDGRGTLIESVTDYARFSLTGTYDFINVGRSGKYLRYNNSYGFASYGSGTGTTLTLYKKFVAATSISLSETELELSDGGMATLTATLAPSGADSIVSWKTSDPSVVTVAAGAVTAEGAGSATITAFIDANSDGFVDPGEINATCSVTVTEGVPATDIELDETFVELLAGQPTTLSATLTPNNSTDAVVWSSSDETIATVSNGTVTTLKNGIVTITATAGSVHADCELSITSATAAENFINAKIDRTGVLIAASGKNAIIDDGQGGFWAFSNSNISQSAGTIVNLKGTSTTYSGGLEVAGAEVTTTTGSISPSEATPLSESAAKNYLDSYLAQPADPDFFMPTKKVSLRTGVIGGNSPYLTWEYGETLMETNYLTGNMQAGKRYDIEGYIFKFYTSNEQTYIVIVVTQASEVELHATSVALDNDSLTIVEGDSETLTATLSPAGSVESVKWASSDEDVATVDDGVVTAVSAGSATITAYIDADDDDVVDLGELKAECEVTVNESPAVLYTKVASYDFSSNTTPSTKEYTAENLLARFNDSDDTSEGLSDIVTNVTSTSKVYQGQTDYCHFGLKFGTSSINGTFTVSLSTQVKRIVVKTISWGVSDTLTIGDADAQTPGVAYNDEVNNPVKTLIFDITQSNSVTFTYATRGYIQSIDFYTGVDSYDPQDFVDTASTIKTIHGHENYTNEVLTSVDSVAIRFGATISKYNWEGMKSKWGITDYGVMLMKATDLTGGGYSSVEDAYDNHASSSVLKIINKCAGGAEYADPYLDGDNYLFTVKVSFPNDDQYYDDVIYAAPFIVVGGQYCFLTETYTSVQDLALDYYDTGYTYLSDAALAMLVGN